MTAMLVERCASVTVFEIDPAYAGWIREYFDDRVPKIVEGDAIATWKSEWEIRPPVRVLGNLPYNVASTVIASFIEANRLAPLMVFTVQEEMGRRMVAEPGNKDYSSFTVLCRTSAVIKDEGRLAPGSFWPVPRVRSRIVSLRPGYPHGSIEDPNLLRRLVRSLFSSRRKTLKNNITAAEHRGVGLPPVPAVRAAFLDQGIDLSQRPETVEPSQWVDAANRLAAFDR